MAFVVVAWLGVVFGTFSGGSLPLLEPYRKSICLIEAL